MFSIQEKDEDGFKKIILRDEFSRTFAEILPYCGGTLRNFSIFQNDKEFNVIDSYSSMEDFEGKVAAKGFPGSKLSPFVCRLKNGVYHFGDQDYKLEHFYLEQHAIHGCLYDKQFAITNEEENEANASVTMKYEYRKDDGGYPFDYDCIITWRLESENKLSAITQIINRDAGLIPIQDGWHPYFMLGDRIDDLQIEFQSDQKVEFDTSLIPTGVLTPYHEYNSLKKIGSASFDNCFFLSMESCQPLCVLRNPIKKIELEIYPGNAYPYLQIYTPPNRKTIAIENLSGPPDAFNNGMGLITLEPGNSAEFKTTYKISLLE
ncbi:MAG: aldose 1-epimerase [Ginsengibacter sp.]